MEKAYDLKVLGDKFKARGLDIAEDAAKGVVEDVIDFLSESALVSPNPYDDLLAASVYPVVKKKLLEKADTIDGKVGE